MDGRIKEHRLIYLKCLESGSAEEEGTPVARGGGKDESGEISDDDEADSPGEDGDYVLSESDDDAPLVRKFIVD